MLRLDRDRKERGMDEGSVVEIDRGTRLACDGGADIVTTLIG
jgi:hypothetical protein